MEEKFEQIIEQLVEKGFGVLDNFLEESEINDLNTSFSERYKKQQFKQAGISKQHEVQKEIRGDKIFWLEKQSADNAESHFLQKLEDFIQYLNYTCFMGLRGYEIHYASYPIGTFYKSHLDTFRKDSGRKLSFICYINENWQPENKGELVLHLADNKLEIMPNGGRLVCFESDKILHEVLPATRERRSITGWLKIDVI